MDDVDITEWAQGERVRLEDFIRMWADNHSVTPDEFPDKMPEGEWDEQFRSFEG